MNLVIDINQALSVLMILSLVWTIFKMGEVNQMMKETRKRISNLNGCKTN